MNNPDSPEVVLFFDLEHTRWLIPLLDPSTQQELQKSLKKTAQVMAEKKFDRYDSAPAWNEIVQTIPQPNRRS